MFRAQTKLTLLTWLLMATLATAADFSGTSALSFTRDAVAFGPRPPGSDANHKLQAYIIAKLKADGCEIIEDPFTSKTPHGDIAMKNIIAKFPGKSGQAIAITGHFDTKFFAAPRKFVGANDGGSSTGLLLELAQSLARKPRTDDVYLVWFDGEEAFGEWSDTDSLYGSRHLADRWRKDQTLTRIKALINIDMIGDKQLNIKQETNSTERLRRLVWSTASELGYGAYFVKEILGAEEDDHIPFLKQGVPSLDIIDIDYPPWHEDSDTMDKVGAPSLEIVGTVVLEVIHRVEIGR